MNTNSNPIFTTRFGALGVIGLSALVAAFYGCSSSSGSPVTPTDGGDDSSVPEGDGAPPDDTGTTPPTDTGTTPPPDTGTTPPDTGTTPPDASDAGPTVVNQKVTETKLFADTADAGAAHVDTNLVNPWGIAFNPSGPAWVADNHGGVATVYKTNSTASLLTVTIPFAANDAGNTAGSPTGQIFNSTTDFLGDKFLLASEDGIISGWQAGDGGSPSTAAVARANRSGVGAVYKGLAIVPSTPQVLLAADFHNGHVDVFDATYHLVTPDGGAPDAGAAGSWSDPSIPAGYAPFNIVTIGTSVYIVYAKQDDPTDAMDNANGAGFGAVSVFDLTGKLVKSLIKVGGALNAPWGLTAVPAGGWGGLAAGALVIGDFGDGAINAFDPTSGAVVGHIVTSAGTPLLIEGLWGLEFGAVNDTDSGESTKQLYFAAGPNDENNGLFGYLTVQ